ncbi:MAG: hypothetical protein OXK79_01540 [Chloroflexota bacterium]|nr:hypothetical protein [Chloroflexota bacterium]
MRHDRRQAWLDTAAGELATCDADNICRAERRGDEESAGDSRAARCGSSESEVTEPPVVGEIMVTLAYL